MFKGGAMRVQQPENQNQKVVTLRVPLELDARLEALEKETGRTKSSYIQEAIEEFLEEREDYLLAVAALERNEPTISLAELEKKLGVAH
jgi:RHH-type rel operon transcriptional repressor/antitoxin RelB